MLVRMLAHPLPEARECAARMLVELRKVIPAFLTRVDREDRGAATAATSAAPSSRRRRSPSGSCRRRTGAGAGAGAAG